MTVKKFIPKGFTLIETLVAVMILATAVAGPLSIASRSLNNSIVAKDQITAFYLAQDAVEYVRYVRDTNTLASQDWIAGTGGNVSTNLTPCVGAGQSCYLDSTANSPAFPTACPGGACPAINYDTGNSRYTYDAAGSGSVVASPFTRSITLTQINPASGSPVTEYKLTVLITWYDLGNVQRSVTVNENIFSWQG